MRTQKINHLLWFFAVGLSGKDGVARKWRMKTLPTLLKQNNHIEAGQFFMVTTTTIAIIIITIDHTIYTTQSVQRCEVFGYRSACWVTFLVSDCRHIEKI